MYTLHGFQLPKCLILFTYLTFDHQIASVYMTSGIPMYSVNSYIVC